MARTVFVALLVVGLSHGSSRAGFVIVADQGADDIISVDMSTGVQKVVSARGLLTAPSGIALAPDGTLLVANRYSQDVVRINLETGSQSIVTAGGFLRDPMSLAVAPNGTIYAIDPDQLPDGSRVGVVSIDPTTGAQTRLSWGQNLNVAYGIAVEQNGDILVGNRGEQAGGAYHDGSIVRIDPLTGSQTVLTAGGLLANPDHLTVAPDGNILVADHDAFDNGITAGAVFSVNPLTGAQSVVSSGTYYGGPAGITMGPGGDVFVSDANAAAIHLVDPSTGSDVVLTEGGDLVNPYGLAYVVTPTPAPCGLVLAATAAVALLGYGWVRCRLGT